MLKSLAKCRPGQRGPTSTSAESSLGKPQRSGSTSISQALAPLGENPSPERKILVFAQDDARVLVGFKRGKEGSGCCSCAVCEQASSHKLLPACKIYLPGMVLWGIFYQVSLPSALAIRLATGTEMEQEKYNFQPEI